MGQGVLSFLSQCYPPVKRAADIIVSLLALIGLVVPLIFVWIAVKLTSPGPGLFWSDRVGRNGKIFRMPKFRTMTVCSKVVSREKAEACDITFTPIGQFLRKSSIDELPQFYSVLVGHMSLIGPRPVLPQDEATTLRSSCEKTMDIRPGITGLAQVKGRNNVSPRRKAKYDSFYAHNMCAVFDAKIIANTVKILHRTHLVQ